MGAVNLGTWRIAIIVALVVVGVAVLANGFDDGDAAVATPSVSITPSPSPADGTGGGDGEGEGPAEPPEPTPPPNKKGVLVKVFNGTSTDLLAAEVQVELVEAGQVAPEDPANAPASPVAKTTVYYRGGPDADQHQADATFIARKYIKPVLTKMPQIEELADDLDQEVGDTITVVVLLGEDYAANLEDEG
jgi:hypothetical protein